MPAPAIATKPTAEPKATIPAMEERIRIRAYERYLERAGRDGSDIEDWLQAEEEVRHEESLGL